MHIPVRLGLVGKSGNALPLTLDGENETGPETRVVELTEAEQRFVFVDVVEVPLLSLGRGFSAPAIFKTQSTRRDRAVLMGADSDVMRPVRGLQSDAKNARRWGRRIHGR